MNYPGYETRRQRHGENIKGIFLSEMIDTNHSDQKVTLEVSMRKSRYPSRWRGRGMMQLTHCVNYLMYASYRANLDRCYKKELSNDCVNYAYAHSSNQLFSASGKEVLVSIIKITPKLILMRAHYFQIQIHYQMYVAQGISLNLLHGFGKMVEREVVAQKF